MGMSVSEQGLSVLEGSIWNDERDFRHHAMEEKLKRIIEPSRSGYCPWR